MQIQLHEKLEEAFKNNSVPGITAYNRIDGPGSSLDLREFQQSLWSMPTIPADIDADPAMQWSRKLPRTIGITIDTGTKIEALPYEPDRICVKSTEYGTTVSGKPGEIPPIKENWLLKIVEIFGLSGVKFVLQNLRAGIQSSGLGGSATATTGLCILANELANRPLSPIQIVSMASRIENDFGVSITGTQEQSNVVFGGVTDYIWFPWGVPGQAGTNYGESIRSELLEPHEYDELEKRSAIFHTGKARASSNVNSVWMEALFSKQGYQLHTQKMEVAYAFREGIRLKRWDQAAKSIADYRDMRTRLCSDYMAGAEEISGRAELNGCVAFPLGAGGGGGVFLFSAEPDAMNNLRDDLNGIYREIKFKIINKGFEFYNL